MSLDKKDLGQIEKLVEKSENRLEKLIEKVVEKSENRMEKLIETLIEKSENRIISIISRKVNDLAETNTAIIQKVDTIAELEKRIFRIETKIGIAR